MHNNDTLNALIFISRTHRNIHSKRISQEFKLTVTILTFYMLSVKFVLSAPNYFDIRNCCLESLIWLIFIFIAVIAFIYLKGSAEANNINQKIAENAENEIMKSLKNDSIDVNLYPHDYGAHPNKDRWLLQTLIIFAIGVLSAITLTYILRFSRYFCV